MNLVHVRMLLLPTQLAQAVSVSTCSLQFATQCGNTLLPCRCLSAAATQADNAGLESAPFRLQMLLCLVPGGL